MLKCKHKHGLLILRECGQAAQERCPNCGKPICTAHTARHMNQILCYDCKAAPVSDGAGADGYTRQAFMRNSYYNALGYSPFYSRRFHDSHFDDRIYDDYDYDTFNNTDAGIAYDDFGDDMNEDDFSDS